MGQQDKFNQQNQSNDPGNDRDQMENKGNQQSFGQSGAGSMTGGQQDDQFSNQESRSTAAGQGAGGQGSSFGNSQQGGSQGSSMGGSQQGSGQGSSFGGTQDPVLDSKSGRNDESDFAEPGNTRSGQGHSER